VKNKAAYISKRKRHELLRSQLETERSSFMPQWRDLADYILPTRPRFQITDANRGTRKNQKIVNSHATQSADTLRSGMMSGITSPARTWFKLSTPDPDMAEIGSVKYWLDQTGRRMADVFLRSNLYNVLPQVYSDLGAFGTAPMLVEEDFDEVIRAFSLPIGSYMIAKDSKGRVNTLFREFRMTVRQLVEEFAKRDEKSGEIDWSNFSTHIRERWQQGQTETWVDVCHVVQPNEDYDEKQLDSKYKKFASCYYERGTSGPKSQGYLQSGDGEIYLRESGYDYFPVLCPRWEVTGEDVYGTNCPGMKAIGDIKQLQLMEKRVAQAIEKMINPPMVGPVSLRNSKVSILPGDTTYADEREGQKGFRPAHEINFRTNEVDLKIEKIEHRISRCFYEDLFLMLANDNRSNITAREIDERHEEKLLALGPVLEQLNQDLLDPLIKIVFQIMMNQGWILEPPEELQGQDLKVEYISVMAQAQKLIAIGSLERTAQFAMQIMAVQPDAGLKINFDQMIDEYGTSVGVPSKVIRTDEEVAGLRAQVAQAQQMQAKSQMMNEMTGSVKNLSQADTSGENALTALMDQANAGSLV